MLAIWRMFPGNQIAKEDHMHYTENQITVLKIDFATLKSSEGLAALHTSACYHHPSSCALTSGV